MACINCSTEYSGNFCPQCGQRAAVKRISFREAWNDFWSRVYGFDGMFPRTLRDLTIRPGLVAKKYLEGNRVQYYGPVGYCFLMVAVLLLVLDFMGMSFAELMSSTPQALKPTTDKQIAFSQRLVQIVSDNIRLLFFAWIPFQAFMAQRLFFRKAGMNFLEHTVLPFYIMGHGLWLTMLMAFLLKLGVNSNMWMALISILYFAYAYADMMRYQGRVRAFLKGLGVWIIAYLAFILFFMVALLGLILIMSVTSPETLKSWFS